MKKNGFTLVEVVLATGISASCITILIGLFALGLKNTRDSQIYSAVALVSENIRSRLLADWDWPMPQNQPLSYTNGIYQTNFYYNLEGLENSPDNAILRAEICFVQSSYAYYSSPRLDLIFMDFYEAKNNHFIARHYTQRAHPQARP